MANGSPPPKKRTSAMGNTRRAGAIRPMLDGQYNVRSYQDGKAPGCNWRTYQRRHCRDSRRNAGRNDGHVWKSSAFICGPGIDGDGDLGRYEDVRREREDPDEQERPVFPSRSEISPCVIARPARRKVNCINGFEVVEIVQNDCSGG
ncbi:hypothetical protein AcW1_002613 [Taiwanofungus camphoratus]|nr:hypothetical protein AcW1_002613 [Antrodia cinnamomea]